MIVPSLFPPPTYAHLAVVEPSERLVFTAGAVPLDDTGALVGPGDVPEQTRQVLTNLTIALQAADSDLQHVVASTVYVASSDPADLTSAWEVVRRSNLASAPHTSTLLGVSALGYPGQLVEITAVAVVPAGGNQSVPPEVAT